MNINSWVLLLNLLFFCAAPALAGSRDPRTEPDKVTLQLKWEHQFQFAGYYAALEKGFYRDEGLDVELLMAKPGLNTDEQVLSGKADFGVGSSSLLLLRSQGKPVVVLAVIFQHSPSVLLTRADTGIRTIHDLAGKKIMLEPNAGSNLGYLQKEHLLGNVHLLRHSFDLNDLISGQVAAQSSFATNEPYVLQRAGIPYRVFSPLDAGIDFYGDNIFTTERQLREHPERVKAFRKATLLGWQYAIAHVEEMVNLIHEKYNPQRSLEALRFEANELKKYALPDVVEVGYMHSGRWSHIASVYRDLGLMKYPVDTHGFLYDPEPRQDVTWLFWLLGISGAGIALAAAVIGYIARTNRRLKDQIVQTQRMRLAAEKAVEDKNRFIAAASHDLGQPMYLLSVQSDDLIAANPPEHVRALAEEIKRTALTLRELFNRIMDISRLDAQFVDVLIHDFEIAETLEQFHREFLPIATQKSMQLRVVRSEAIVRSDKLLLERILRNLLSNAFTHCESGRVLLGCRRRGEKIRIEVWDTGPGVPTEYQEAIFQDFVRVPGRQHRQGTGLGLAIVNRLAKILDHTVVLKSEPGKGSVFAVEVPLAQ